MPGGFWFPFRTQEEWALSSDVTPVHSCLLGQRCWGAWAAGRGFTLFLSELGILMGLRLLPHSGHHGNKGNPSREELQGL